MAKIYSLDGKLLANLPTTVSKPVSKPVLKLVS